ncbi:hypothetical protein F3Y22_tig00110812pilonHSYRG00111 [Hibiscus syriacus]|uniref:Uncharacterized protein n=1 Tax=Hibiscus syriacus TaxID=106335 RepID=A0A6A2ZNU8_HIBSY|nr:hypothetical protein F3Y22_tig00110812pilonHSYRG00111 [Hibiscus syriacus]
MQIKMGGRYHVRSISLPSRSHPTTLRMEDELNRIKTWEASALSTSESISAGLSGLGDLYQCMDDLLNMASINEHVRVLQSSLRRRKFVSTMEDDILRYTSFRKQMRKQAKKLILELKQMDDKLDASPCLDQDHHFWAVIRVLRQVNVTNTSIFRSLFSFLSAPVSSKQTRWSLVAKLMHKGVVACEEKQDVVNEFESVDAAPCRHGLDVDKMQIAHKRLVALESSIEGVEKRVECLFRQLIKARTSLLNIFSQ